MRVGIAGPITVPVFREYLEAAPKDLPSGLGGTPVVALTEQLLRRGHEVVVFTLDRSITREVVLSGKQLKICVGPYRPTKRARNFFRHEGEYLKSAMLREHPEVIHANWTYEFALAALDASRSTLVTVHDAPFQVLRQAPDAYRVVRTIMAFRVASRATHMTAVSGEVANHFCKYLRHRSPIEVIPNLLTQEVFELGRSRERRRSPGVTFASALWWGKLKNATTALEAFKRVRSGMPDSTMLMFGPGFESDGPAHGWASDRGLAEGVEFIGALPHRELLERLATDVDVLVHPSLVEALCVTVMEGMALGLPIIAGAKTGGMSYLLEGGSAGLLVDVRSTAELAEGMLRLAQDSGFRNEMGAAGRQSAVRRFDPDVVLPMYERAYERTLERRG